MKSFRILMAVLAIMLGAAACGTANATDTDVACDVVTTELADARQAAEDADGTPDESEANDLVDALIERREECEAQAPTTTLPTEDEDTQECPDTWLIVDFSYEDDAENPNRFFNGTEVNQIIRDAETDEDAREALQAWLDHTKRDPEYLAGAASFFLHRQVDPATLADAERKCATTAAEALLGELETAFMLSRVTPSEAPANGYNTGINDGNVVGASVPGITGDREAILIELPDGSKVWIMARCGNPVTEGPPPAPPGETDQPPPPSPPPTSPPPSVPPTTPPTTQKPDQDFDCQQNGTAPAGQPCDGDERQDPQDNDPDMVAPTPGAPSQPYVPPPGPTPQEGTPAPPPNDGGYDSGSPDGSGTPGGSTCDTYGCTGGGPEPADEGPPPTVDDGTYGGDPGGF